MSMITSMKQGLARWQAYRDTLAELRMLSDRELDDIGIARRDFRAIAWAAVQANDKPLIPDHAGLESDAWALPIGGALAFKRG